MSTTTNPNTTNLTNFARNAALFEEELTETEATELTSALKELDAFCAVWLERARRRG